MCVTVLHITCHAFCIHLQDDKYEVETVVLEKVYIYIYIHTQVNTACAYGICTSRKHYLFINIINIRVTVENVVIMSVLLIICLCTCVCPPSEASNFILSCITMQLNKFLYFEAVNFSVNGCGLTNEACYKNQPLIVWVLVR